jgi:hypothetical protein
MIRNLFVLLLATLVASQRFLQDEIVANTTVNQTEKLAELARQEKAKLALEKEAVKVAAARVDHLNKMQRCNSFEVLRKNNEKMMPVIDKVVDFFLYLSEVPEKVAEFDDIY